MNFDTKRLETNLYPLQKKDYHCVHCSEFPLWSAAPNRKNHIPYVLRALIINDADRIGDSIECQVGKN